MQNSASHCKPNMTPYVLLLFVVLASSVLEGNCLDVRNNATLSEFCIQETEVTKELVDSYADDPEKEPTEDYYCYLHCIFANVELIDQNGAVQVDLFKTLFEGEFDEDCLKKVPKIVECNDMKAIDDCGKE